MFIVVRLSGLAKNVPGRNRAGFKFDHLPRVVDVNDEQLEIIKTDAYLKICNFPSVAWFDAMNIERTQINEDKMRDKNGNYVGPKKLHKFARDAAFMDGTVPSEAGREIVDPGASGEATEGADGHTPTAQEGVSNGSGGKQPASAVRGAPDGVTAPVPANKPHELTASSSREELVAALTKKRKVEGTDFNKNAEPAALFALLKSL